MSEQLPPLVSHESLRIITAAAQESELSPPVLSFLSASAEYHLLDVLNDASVFSARGKRSRLTVDDVKASLELRGAENSMVIVGGITGIGDDGSSEAGVDTKIDLRKVANASLPVCPIEPGLEMHWLAVEGQQPLLPQNPTPSSSRGKGKNGKRARSSPKQEGGVAEGSGVQARLSEELTSYLKRCCEAVLSREATKRNRALASLRRDPGLQQLLPHLSTFIQTKVTENLKKEKDPDQLAALLQMLQCLLENSHFGFLEIYLDRLLPPVMSCMLHGDFERRGAKNVDSEDYKSSLFSAKASGGGGGGKETASKKRSPVWNHWNVRDYAATLLRAIRDKHGRTYPTLQARASNMCCKQVVDSATPLTTLYGAIRGLASLGPSTVEQSLWPRVDGLVGRISNEFAAAVKRRDTSAVQEANLCMLALLQAAGSTTASKTFKIFGSPAAGTTVAHRRRFRMQKRLDRSLYSRGSSEAVLLASKDAGTAKNVGAAAAVEAASSAVVDAHKMPPPKLVSNGTVSTGEGNAALKEVLVPWFLLGAKRDGSSQNKWLTSRHSLFV